MDDTLSVSYDESEDSPTPPQPQVLRNRITRSMTSEKRRTMATNAGGQTQQPTATATNVTSVKRRRRIYGPKPSARPKSVKIAPSKIPGAGLGLYLLDDAKEGEFVARYSGEPINRTENATRSGHYRIKISNNLYLDAEKSHHFEGRFINDGKRSGRGVNVRFAAGYRTNMCSSTNLRWIRIYATRDIQAGEELYLDYGDDFWVTNDVSTSPNYTRPTRAPTALSPIRRASRKKLQRSQGV